MGGGGLQSGDIDIRSSSMLTCSYPTTHRAVQEGIYSQFKSDRGLVSQSAGQLSLPAFPFSRVKLAALNLGGPKLLGMKIWSR